ncbi:hypothetical protein DSO57_1026769 [Entomophthora muscae]|uniref:Uncharacterized protein n=1 Tax=Entomophthora muscae TaxID=34485 RepID=A0ACC2TNT0_9FUNG|nr:hypothetical protein DSO57_1026769 [Entomophthora muscae]
MDRLYPGDFPTSQELDAERPPPEIQVDTGFISLTNHNNMPLLQLLPKKIDSRPTQDRSLWLLAGVMAMGLSAYFPSLSCTASP